MIYIGIDPGKKGGIAVLDTYEETASAYPYDDELLVHILAGYPACKVAVEEVHAMPGQGVTSMFSFGRSYGYILGVLGAFRISYELVKPQTWKKEFGCTSDKNTSISTCKRLFPMTDLKASERSRKDSDGLAESLLIAEYARRHMK